jgi:hypothetical protein
MFYIKRISGCKYYKLTHVYFMCLHNSSFMPSIKRHALRPSYSYKTHVSYAPTGMSGKLKLFLIIYNRLLVRMSWKTNGKDLRC